jgi:hypothetical protein
MPLPAPWQPLPPEAGGKPSTTAATSRPETAPAVGGAPSGGAQSNPQTLTRLDVDYSDALPSGAAAAYNAEGSMVKPYTPGGSPTVIPVDRRCKTAAAGGRRCASSYVPNTAGLRSIRADTLDRRHTISCIACIVVCAKHDRRWHSQPICLNTPSIRGTDERKRIERSLRREPKTLIPHPSSLIPHPSSLIPHPSSLIPQP